MKMQNKVAILVSVFLLVAAGSALSQGTIIAGHFGSADPTSEGFSLIRNGNPSLTPLTGDLGMNAWSIKLNSLSDIANYSQSLTPQQQADAAAAGWVVSLRFRILQPFGIPTFGIYTSFYTGSEYFSLYFGAQTDGNPIVSLQGVQYVLNDPGAGYHNYQLRNAGTGFASFWVDGAHVADAAGSLNPSTARFSWGGGQNPVGSVGANWYEASLSVIPEPSTLALLGLGVGTFAARVLRWPRSKL